MQYYIPHEGFKCIWSAFIFSNNNEKLQHILLKFCPKHKLVNVNLSKLIFHIFQEFNVFTIIQGRTILNTFVVEK